MDTDYVERVAARLSGPNDQPWQVGDDAVDNIHWLSVDFMCAVFEETDVPLGRAHLARDGIESFYARRYEDGAPVETERLLQLKQQDVRQQLDEIGSFTSSHPHRRAAFFSLLPTWLEFLERRELLNTASTNTMYHNLRPLRNGVTDTLRRFSQDPTLVDDVKAAWG